MSNKITKSNIFNSPITKLLKKITKMIYFITKKALLKAENTVFEEP